MDLFFATSYFGTRILNIPTCIQLIYSIRVLTHMYCYTQIHTHTYSTTHVYDYVYDI